MHHLILFKENRLEFFFIVFTIKQIILEQNGNIKKKTRLIINQNDVFVNIDRYYE